MLGSAVARATARTTAGNRMMNMTQVRNGSFHAFRFRSNNATSVAKKSCVTCSNPCSKIVPSGRGFCKTTFNEALSKEPFPIRGEKRFFRQDEEVEKFLRQNAGVFNHSKSGPAASSGGGGGGSTSSVSSSSSSSSASAATSTTCSNLSSKTAPSPRCTVENGVYKENPSLERKCYTNEIFVSNSAPTTATMPQWDQVGAATVFGYSAFGVAFFSAYSVFMFGGVNPGNGQGQEKRNEITSSALKKWFMKYISR